MNKSCGECGKLRTGLCTRPDYCVQHGYSDFAPSRPWKRCENCGGAIRRIRTDHPSKNVCVTDLRCADCGLVAEERREYIRKTPAK
jgi:hypothetical protein